MKRILMGAALGSLLVGPVQAQPAADGSAKANVCLDITRIDHTTVPDSRTILFYMQDRKIWKNTLRNDCVGLTYYGFAYEPTPPNQICGNLQTIRVVHDGTVCMLGAFEPYTPPPKDKPAH